MTDQSHDPLLAALDDPQRCNAALRDLAGLLSVGDASLEPQAFAAVFELLRAPTKTTRRLASDVLAAVATEPLIHRRLSSALGCEDPLQSWGVCFAMAGAADRVDKAVAGAALRALQIDDGDVRWAAAEIVRSGLSGVKGFVDDVVAVAQDGSSTPRKMALYCLRDAGHDDPGVFALALRADHAGVRLAGLAGLQRMGKVCREADRAGVIACLHSDSDVGVRRAAAVCLGSIMGRDRAAREVLVAVAADKSDLVLARAARWALDASARAGKDVSGGESND